MNTPNYMYTSIDTDKDLSTIFGRFSDDLIENTVLESLQYKFRPFGNRLPNYPFTINEHFNGLIANYNGDPSVIIAKKNEILYDMLRIICNAYNLQISTEIPDEQLYSLVYVLYQILVSEFTDKMFTFYSNYIVSNKDTLLAAIPDDQKIQIRSTYTKKMYSDPTIISLYENMEKIIDLVTSLPISFNKLMETLSDPNTAAFISTYITDINDIYKNHYAVYIMDQNTRTDVITTIKIRFMTITQQNMNISAGVNNPYIV